MTALLRKAADYIKGLRGEAIRYIIVGALTTLVNFSAFAIMTKLMNIDVTVSNVTSISLSILFAYVTNKIVVFRAHSSSAAELLLEFFKFVGSRLFTMALEVGAVLLFAGALGQTALFSKLVSQVLVIVGNYVISKAVVFRKPSPDTPQDD